MAAQERRGMKNLRVSVSLFMVPSVVNRDTSGETKKPDNRRIPRLSGELKKVLVVFAAGAARRLYTSLEFQR
jgi:hypothetical protein